MNDGKSKEQVHLTAFRSVLPGRCSPGVGVCRLGQAPSGLGEGPPCSIVLLGSSCSVCVCGGGSLLSAPESKEPLILEERAFSDFDLPGIGSVRTLRRALYI